MFSSSHSAESWGWRDMSGVLVSWPVSAVATAVEIPTPQLHSKPIMYSPLLIIQCWLRSVALIFVIRWGSLKLHAAHDNFPPELQDHNNILWWRIKCNDAIYISSPAVLIVDLQFNKLACICSMTCLLTWEQYFRILTASIPAINNEPFLYLLWIKRVISLSKFLADDHHDDELLKLARWHWR